MLQELMHKPLITQHWLFPSQRAVSLKEAPLNIYIIDMFDAANWTVEDWDSLTLCLVAISCFFLQK